MEQREAERQAIVQQYPGLYRIITILVFIGVGILIGWILFADKDGYGMNLWTEFVGAGFTYLVLDWWRRQQDKKEQQTLDNERLLTNLVHQMRSAVPSEVQRAAEQLDQHNRFQDGSLAGADLQRCKFPTIIIREANFAKTKLSIARFEGSTLLDANLTESKLSSATFEKVTIGNSNLSFATLDYCELRQVKIVKSDLCHTMFQHSRLENIEIYSSNLASIYLEGSQMINVKIFRSSLQNADLIDANIEQITLKDVDLKNANFEGTMIIGAEFDNVNLEGANLDGVSIRVISGDGKIILPDGKEIETLFLPKELKRFSDPNHPEFWRSKDIESPAYRAD